jgi:hypothetical protein
MKERVNIDKQVVRDKPQKALNVPFEDFWREYDKKVDKPRAEKAWSRLTNKERVAVMLYIPRYKQFVPDKTYRKNPFTFFHNRSWENELIGKPAVKPVYGDLLNDPRWQRKRLEVMQRDDFSCQLCSDTQTELQVHHKKYVSGRQPWEYDAKELITLCVHCHEKVSNV